MITHALASVHRLGDLCQIFNIVVCTALLPKCVVSLILAPLKSFDILALYKFDYYYYYYYFVTHVRPLIELWA